MPLDLAHDLILRWSDPDPAHVPVLRQAAIAAVIPSAAHEGFAGACTAAGIRVLPAAEFHFTDVAAFHKAPAGPHAALTNGLWPGITRPPVESTAEEVGAASRGTWVDANGFWAAYLRAMYPQRAALLAHVPELGDRVVPYDTLELALIEARANGGNYLLTVEPGFRKALLEGEAKAVEAWKQLGRTADWLKQRRALLQAPAVPTITLLVEPGEETAELGNLMFRHNASPLMTRMTDLGAPNGKARAVLVAANLHGPSSADAERLLAHAQAGTVLVTAAAAESRWWAKAPLKALKKDEDRDVYGLGTGRVVAYKEAVGDPSEFALDVIDLATHRRRAVRLWNAPAVIATVAPAGAGAGRVLRLINYGRRMNHELQVYVRGQFSKAVLMRPEGADVTLQPKPRGAQSELLIPELARFAIVTLS